MFLFNKFWQYLYFKLHRCYSFVASVDHSFKLNIKSVFCSVFIRTIRSVPIVRVDLKRKPNVRVIADDNCTRLCIGIVCGSRYAPRVSTILNPELVKPRNLFILHSLWNQNNFVCEHISCLKNQKPHHVYLWYSKDVHR